MTKLKLVLFLLKIKNQKPDVSDKIKNYKNFNKKKLNVEESN